MCVSQFVVQVVVSSLEVCNRSFERFYLSEHPVSEMLNLRLEG